MKKEIKKPIVRNFFYESEEVIGNNLLYKWFSKKDIVTVVLKITDSKGLPYKLNGRIAAVGQFEIVLDEAPKGEKADLRIIYKHDISSVRKKTNGE